VTESSPLSARPQRRGVARYIELVDDLVRRIGGGEFGQEGRLPTETTMARSYGVNRLTVRRALGELARDGLIRTEHGVGSFVQQPTVRHRVDDGHASLWESMSARGLRVGHEVLATEVVEPADLQLHFEHWPGDLVRFRFRRTLEDIPWSVSEVVMPASLAPRDWDGQKSLTTILGERNLAVVRAERAFSARLADASDARWLDVQVGAAVLVVSGYNTDTEGHEVMRVRHHTRADRAEYVIRVDTNVDTVVRPPDS
jgi:GntR family transcriptional regulator